MRKSKPLIIYLLPEERKDLEKLKTALGQKTMSSTVKQIIKLIHQLNYTKE